MIRRTRSFAAAILFLLASLPIYAHPHMWIDGRLQPEIGRRGLEAVRITWTIDEMTSSPLILDYDLDRNGELDPTEVQDLRRMAFEHLLDYEYYLAVEIRGMLATPGRATDFDARIENGRVIYEFRVPLEVAIRWEDLPDVGIFLFDNSYFIDFRPDDLESTTVEWKGRSVSFLKMSRRSQTMGYGMVEVTGLVVGRVDE